MPKNLPTPPPFDPSDFIALAMYLRDVSDADGASVVAEAAKFGVNRRKAQYLVTIAKAIDRLDVPHERLRRIGWTKLKVIAKHVDGHNAADLLKAAEDHQVPALRKLVAGQEPPARSHVMMFHLDGPQHALVRAALLAHGATPSTRGLHEKEAALVAALTAASG